MSLHTKWTPLEL